MREFIASRITATFESRRAALRSEARQAGADATGISARLDALNREQGALIAKVVGAEEPPADATAAPISDIVSGAEGQVLMPAVMADALPATVKTEEQAAEWGRLRDNFVDAVSGTHADPASPQYRRRWVQAESEADQRFRFLFGDTAYVQHQMQAQREAQMREQGMTGK